MIVFVHLVCESIERLPGLFHSKHCYVFRQYLILLFDFACNVPTPQYTMTRWRRRVNVNLPGAFPKLYVIESMSTTNGSMWLHGVCRFGGRISNAFRVVWFCFFSLRIELPPMQMNGLHHEKNKQQQQNRSMGAEFKMWPSKDRTGSMDWSIPINIHPYFNYMKLCCLRFRIEEKKTSNRLDLSLAFTSSY